MSNIFQPEAVIFDLDNTLYPYKPSHEVALSAAKKTFQEHGISAEEFEIKYDKARHYVKNLTANTAASHSRLLYFQKLVRDALNKPAAQLVLSLNESYWESYISSMKLEDGALNFLKKLKSKGIKVAIVTDLLTEIQLKKIAYLKIEEYVDLVITSEEAGVDKPDLKIFNLAFDYLKIEPKKCWMIGDSFEKDIMPAKDLNMYSIWFKNSFFEELNNQNLTADMTTSSFQDLIDKI